LHQGAATATPVDDPPHADGDCGDRNAGRQECDRRQLRTSISLISPIDFSTVCRPALTWF